MAEYFPSYRQALGRHLVDMKRRKQVVSKITAICLSDYSSAVLSSSQESPSFLMTVHGDRMGRDDSRVYVGNLPPDVREKDIEDIFAKYGKIRFIDIKGGRGPLYAFIDFDDPRCD
ncbi:hypothetical protein Y032_0003g1581 [Ancylostoma ceylanicum]|uniref:RRM domain-containing protein n=1 Tax=Ancylostoma ceylanicum TaxID=53326 RepID=A0A016VYP7_9BILA|nr:hypothetical protein Y032_0003g1581 [Ancylostoma ceylanicum]